MPFQVTLGDRLRILRATRGLTQKDLAKRAGIEPVTVTNIENYKRNPKDATLELLARALEVDVDAFKSDVLCARAVLKLMAVLPHEIVRVLGPSVDTHVERPYSRPPSPYEPPPKSENPDAPVTRGEFDRAIARLEKQLARVHAPPKDVTTGTDVTTGADETTGEDETSAPDETSGPELMPGSD